MDIKEWLGKENKIGIDIWEKKYRYKNETFDEWLNRVSGGNKELKQSIVEKKFLFGGRTLANRQTNNKGSYFNCYSAGYVEDDYKEIMDTNTKLGLTYKAQGGQGVSFSKLRPKGTPIGESYTSDGIIPFMKIYNETTRGTSQGGCIQKDELVLTNNGCKKISDVKIGDKVWTKTGFVEVNYVFDKGVQPIYEVETKKGYKIKTTLDHKFSIDGFNTKPLSELKVGDNVNIISKNAMNGSFDPLSYFLGYFNGNGWVAEDYNGGTLTIHWDQVEIKDRLIKIINELGFDAYESEKCEGSFRRIRLVDKLIIYLREKGLLKNKTQEIEIPDIILNGSNDMVISYISGAIDSDGVVYDSAFKYDTISKKYAEQMMILLTRVGFFPTLSKQENREGNRETLYSVRDSFRENQPRLFSIKKEQKFKSFVKNSKMSTPYTIENTNMDRNKHKHLKKIGKKYNIGLYTYIQATKDDKDFYSPIIIDEIISINHCGDDNVYDISLESEHLFYCNGFYVSNSRKGALLISLDVRHKEAEDFIKLKTNETEIDKANLSLEIDDGFMEAVREYYRTGKEIVLHEKREYSGHVVEYDIIPIKLYKLMMETVYDWGEPGVLYTGRFRNYNLMELDDEYQVETCNPLANL